MLRNDATLADLAGSARQKEQFIRCCIDSFFLSRLDLSSAILRIGVQGRGIKPNYRIERPKHIDERESKPCDLLVFNGGTHKPMNAFAGQRVREDTWSTAAMSFSEVQALFGQLSASKLATTEQERAVRRTHAPLNRPCVAAHQT